MAPESFEVVAPCGCAGSSGSGGTRYSPCGKNGHHSLTPELLLARVKVSDNSTLQPEVDRLKAEVKTLSERLGGETRRAELAEMKVRDLQTAMSTVPPSKEDEGESALRDLVNEGKHPSPEPPVGHGKGKNPRVR